MVLVGLRGLSWASGLFPWSRHSRRALFRGDETGKALGRAVSACWGLTNLTLNLEENEIGLGLGSEGPPRDTFFGAARHRSRPTLSICSAEVMRAPELRAWLSAPAGFSRT